MEDYDLDDHINAVLSAIDEKKKVNPEEIAKELHRFLEYGVPLEHAKQTLIKKYGGNTTTPAQGITLISDIQSGKSSVNILGRVLTITPKETTVKGEKKTLYYGIIGDENATIPFTAWNDFNIQQNDVLEISNAYTREWQGTLKLNLGDRTKVEKTDQNKVPERSLEPQKYTVKEFRRGLGMVETTVRILSVDERSVTVKDSSKTVFSGVIGDTTSKTQFTAWHNFKLKKGDTIHLSGAYIKTWKGIPQLTFDDKAQVEKLAKDTIKEKDIPHPHYELHALEEKQGGYDVEITGTVIEIRYGSGMIQRCSECNRSIQGTNCSLHGSVTPVPDLRLKLIIDDGTGAITAILNKEISETLLNKPFIELQKIAEKEGEQTLIEDINTKIFGHQLKLRGNVLSDDFGLTLIAQNVSINETSIEDYYNTISHNLEGFQ